MKSGNKTVLVSGASIAGPTLAFWLAKYGFNVTVVERSKSLRLGGQNLDVRGAGRAIVRLMGIENEILSANTSEIGLQFVNADNQVEAAFPADGGDSFTSEAEILRGDLVNILYNRTKDEVSYVFGKYIKAIDRDDSNVFDGISQVHALRWFNGRTGMIGDAAYCPTPLTGMGTTLAMVGAYLLAGELSRNNNYEDAFVAYEKRMRPIVEDVQRLPPGVPWLAHPKSKFGVSMVNTVASILASSPVKKISKLFSSQEKDPTKDKIDIPNFND